MLDGRRCCRWENFQPSAAVTGVSTTASSFKWHSITRANLATTRSERCGLGLSILATQDRSVSNCLRLSYTAPSSPDGV